MKDIAGELTAFLIKINSGITQGLPTGPFVTSILADILMTDVDEFIKNKNFEVIRYMDDIRVYSDNKEELQSFKEELQSYLEKEHKLCLSPTKTKIFKNSEFHESENLKLLNEEIIQKLIDKVIEKSDVYKKFEKVTIDDLTIKDRISVLNQQEIELLIAMMKIKKYDYKVTMNAVYQAERKKVDTLLPLIFSDFDYFFPTIKYISKYIDTMFSENLMQKYFNSFYKVLNDSETIEKLYTDEECVAVCFSLYLYDDVEKLIFYLRLIHKFGRQTLWNLFNRQKLGTQKLSVHSPDYYGFFGEYYSSEV